MASDEPRLGRPLEGIRVIDTSRVLAGPFCGSLLADLGADVVRVEHPTPKDEVRIWRPGKAGYSAAFLSVNHSKRSLALDLGKNGGAVILRRLIATADVLIENFRPGTFERYGINLSKVREDNPRLIHCSVRAFPAGCAAENLPGYEASIQAYSGIMSITGLYDGEPSRCGPSVVDLSTGLMSTIAVLSALRDRDRTGKGQYVEPSLLKTATHLLAYQISGYFLDGSLPQRRGSGHEALVPYRAYACDDGPLFIAAGNDRLWAALCKLLNLHKADGSVPWPSLAERLDARVEVDALVAQQAARWKRVELMAELKAAGIPCAPVNTIAEYVNDPTLFAAGVLQKINVAGIGETVLPGPPFHSEGERPQRRPAPRIGEHTDEILRSIGLGDDEISHLRAQRIVH